MLSPVALILEHVKEEVKEERKKGKVNFSFNNPALDSFSYNSTSYLHVIAIAGSQSSGKSTLLDKAYGFSFPMIDPI
jgi:hypothetical protein